MPIAKTCIFESSDCKGTKFKIEKKVLAMRNIIVKQGYQVVYVCTAHRHIHGLVATENSIKLYMQKMS